MHHMHSSHQNRSEEIIECSSLVTMRADLFLTHLRSDYSRHQLVSRLTSLFVDGAAVKRSFMVRPQSRIVATLARAGMPRALAIPHSLEVLYEDEALLVIDKPIGIAVHPGEGMAANEATIAQAMCARDPRLCEWQEESGYRAGIVHRLDKDTSGVLVLAKTKSIATELQAQFKARAVKKQYVAAVYGRMSIENGEVQLGIARDPRQRTRFTIAEDGKNAHTIYRTMAVFDTYSMVQLFPVTGRTHQLRVHLRALGHPVVGDKRYALNKSRHSALRLMLHAQQISFQHPQQQTQMTISAPLPRIFEQAQQGTLTV